MVYTLLTFLLLRQTIAVRREEREPSLDIYTAPNEVEFVVLDLIIKNSGGGAARNIKLRVEGDVQGLRERRIDLLDWALLEGLPYLAPGQVLRSDMGTHLQFLGGERPIGAVSIHASYRSDRNKSYERDYPLLLAEYKQMSRVQDGQRASIVKSLETLAKAVSPWPRGEYLHVRTQTEEAYLAANEPLDDVENSTNIRWFGWSDRGRRAAIASAILSAAVIGLQALRKKT